MTVFKYDQASGGKMVYDHLTDGIMWAEGLFYDGVKIIVLAPLNNASWSFSSHSVKFRVDRKRKRILPLV